MKKRWMIWILAIACIAVMIPAGYCSQTDVQQLSPWAERTFRRCNELNLLDAGGLYSNGQLPITRVQFVGLAVTLVEQAKGEPLSLGTPVFYDTASIPAQKAANAGITVGTGNGKFSPDLPITRQEISVMLLKAVNLVAGDAVKAPISLDKYTDGGQVAGWARQAVGSMVSSGLMSGVSQTELAPLANTTTEQAVMLLYKAYSLISGQKLAPWTEEFLTARRQGEESFQRQYSGATDFVDQRIDSMALVEVYGKSLGYNGTYLVFLVEYSLKSPRPEELFLAGDMWVNEEGWMSTGLPVYGIFRQEENGLHVVATFSCEFGPEGNQQMFRQSFDNALFRSAQI